jgi:hypothetical protein
MSSEIFFDLYKHTFMGQYETQVGAASVMVKSLCVNDAIASESFIKIPIVNASCMQIGELILKTAYIPHQFQTFAFDSENVESKVYYEE